MTLIEKTLKEFDENFLVSMENDKGWKLPRIAYYWEESGTDVEWEDMEQEIKSFITQALQEQDRESKDKIKQAFIKRFLGAGELWFPYGFEDDREKQFAIEDIEELWGEVIELTKQDEN